MNLAIVGAGTAGAAAAYRLRNADVDVTVFEKSRGVSGRAATRRKHGCVYDHGANYVKADSKRVTELVTETLPTDGLVDIDKPVWTFDRDGNVEPGTRQDDSKWTYTDGITQLAKRLFAQTDIDIEFETRVGGLERIAGKWRLVDDDGDPLGVFDRVLLTPPAPQTVSLLEATDWDDTRVDTLLTAVDAVPYRTIYSVILHYPFAVEYPWYALVNTDRDHDVGWLSREELKPGHVSDGETLFVVQMSPGWSAKRYDDPPVEVKRDVAALVAKLLDDERFVEPDWTDRQGWRYALPDAGADRDVVRAAEPAGLYVAGDWVEGEGRVHSAIESGLDVAARIQ